MKKYILVLAILFLWRYLSAQTDNLNFETILLNHSKAPISISSFNAECIKYELILKFIIKNKVNTNINSIKFKVNFYDKADELIKSDIFEHFATIYPEEEITVTKNIYLDIFSSEIGKILIYPFYVDYSLNLQWFLSNFITPYKNEIVETKKKFEKSAFPVKPKPPDSSITSNKSDSTQATVDDTIKISFFPIPEDTLHVEKSTKQKIREITAVKINNITAIDTSQINNNIVNEVSGDTITVELGKNYIDEDKKYILVRDQNGKEKNIALAKAVVIGEFESKLIVTYYYTKEMPEKGDKLFEYILLRQNLNLIDYIYKYKKEEFFALSLLSWGLCYSYNAKSETAYENYRTADTSEEATKYRSDLINYEKMRDKIFYFSVVFSAGFLISYIYDYLVKEKKKYEKTYSRIKLTAEYKNTATFGIKVKF